MFSWLRAGWLPGSAIPYLRQQLVSSPEQLMMKGPCLWSSFGVDIAFPYVFLTGLGLQGLLRQAFGRNGLELST